MTSVDLEEEEGERLKSRYRGGSYWARQCWSLRAPCLWCSYLDELSVAGECAAEYLALYQKLIASCHWKVYLAARGVLPYVGNLITKVIDLSLPVLPLLGKELCRILVFEKEHLVKRIIFQTLL